MFFNLFGKKDSPKGDEAVRDRVYISSEGKMNACIALAKDSPNYIFIGWFNKTVQLFKENFIKNGIEENRVFEAKHFNSSLLQNKTAIFLEHYPLHEKEAIFISNWEQNPILIFSALDEPIFKMLGSEKMIPLIKMMGMKEDEAIEHNYVTQSIKRGQQKMAEKITFEKTAESQEEWMKKNISETSL